MRGGGGGGGRIAVNDVMISLCGRVVDIIGIRSCHS